MHASSTFPAGKYCDATAKSCSEEDVLVGQAFAGIHLDGEKHLSTAVHVMTLVYLMTVASSVVSEDVDSPSNNEHQQAF